MDCKFKKITITFEELSIHNRNLIYQKLHNGNLKDEDIHFETSPLSIWYYVEVPFDCNVNDAVILQKRFLRQHDIPFISVTHN